ncbi:MAG: autotransporter assembly complex protein TamA [Wenzhouxiangella sp.]
MKTLRWIAAIWLMTCLPVLADTLDVRIDGVDGAQLANVRAHLGLVRAADLDDVSAWRLRQLAGDARGEIREALRPFGFYRPRIEVRLEEPETEGGRWIARINIQPGPPVTIRELDIQIIGEGSDDPDLMEWLAEFPLGEGSRLLHAEYDDAWRDLDRLAVSRGFFDARFLLRRITVDPDRNTANVRIRFLTGPRYRFGRHDAGDTRFSPRLIDRLTIVEDGEPFSSTRLDEQREVLVRSGFFERVAVETEQVREDARVDLRYRLEERPPNSYRVTAGLGTDTGARVQLGWQRHYLSSRGNRLDIGFGAQQRNNEFVLRSEYQHPRGQRPGEFLTLGGVLRREQDNFRFNDESRREAIFDSFSGSREQAELIAGRLTERRPFNSRFGVVEERIFISALNESFNAFREARFSDENEALLAANPGLVDVLATETNTLSLGASWRMPKLRGSGFFAEGHVIEARVLAADESLGSDVSFAQAYLGGRWHRILGDRHKFIVRAEAGYTDADTRTFDLTLDDRELRLDITELPERYRFKTGGDRTVRGYAFETLSTNRNGGNHILSGTAEYEYRVGRDWSLAAFFDVGNAFNDWSNPNLKRGVGAGFRWYTLIGPVQLDVAQALDDVDRPWRIHFTIGTRLL